MGKKQLSVNHCAGVLLNHRASNVVHAAPLTKGLSTVFQDGSCWALGGDATRENAGSGLDVSPASFRE